MSRARRLSKLQAYILRAAIENEGRIPSSRRLCVGYWGAERVYSDCLAFHRYHRRGEKCIGDKYRASLSRSLQNLEDKGFIEPPMFRWKGTHRPRPIELSYQGDRLALKLTSVGGAELKRLCEAALKLTARARTRPRKAPRESTSRVA